MAFHIRLYVLTISESIKIKTLTGMGFLFPDFFFFFFWPHHAACGILVPQPGIEPVPPAVEAQSLNHWTAREVPLFPDFKVVIVLMAH